MAKVLHIPVVPRKRVARARVLSPPGEGNRYIEGQKVLIDAMKYLAKSDRRGNKAAVRLLSEHFRTQFRMSDRPAPIQ